MNLALTERGLIIQFCREREREKKKQHTTLQHAQFFFFFFFWRKKLLIPTALNDGTAIRVAAFFALAASQRKTNKAARFRNLIRLWVPEQLKYYSWSASVNPPMESIYRWSLRYWWSVTGLFYLIFFSSSCRSERRSSRCVHVRARRAKKKNIEREEKKLLIFIKVSLKDKLNTFKLFFFIPSRSDVHSIMTRCFNRATPIETSVMI